MISDLDQLMQSLNLDAILVTGPAQHNPPMVYLTGGAHLTSADLIKKRGSKPVLFHNSMERDEAAKTGLPTKSLSDYRLDELLKHNNGNLLQATIQRYQKMLADLDLTTARLAIYGKIDAGTAYAIFSGLESSLPGLTIVGQVGDSLLLQAMATKGKEEVERIRKMGKITTRVVGNVADFLTSHKVTDEVLLKSDGNPLTIADVKSRINLWLAEQGAENPEGTIFSIGRDAGVPHSSGNPADLLRLGQTIIFDIFPCEAGGGYYYDFTRTWCLGYAPDDVQSVYEDVLAVFHQIMGELKVNTACRDYQNRTCELFEARGHPTVKGNPQTEIGYVHGLGHGLGLQIHEYPRFSFFAPEDERLVPGSVITVEPGLYYPERGMGVRLEDTVWVRPDGQIETLAEYPLDLVLPMKAT
ncbi:MAG TPA: Xaa-Pro peptidase family protein [Anaerolineales bacterium]|nr:Xaa-Pro peptidase family protein [Anaerolineales bacterium]